MRAQLIVSKVARVRRKGCEEVTLMAHFDGPTQRSGESFSENLPTARLQFTVENPRFLGSFEPGELWELELKPVKPKAGEKVADMPRAA